MNYYDGALLVCLLMAPGNVRPPPPGRRHPVRFDRLADRVGDAREKKFASFFFPIPNPPPSFATQNGTELKIQLAFTHNFLKISSPEAYDDAQINKLISSLEGPKN
ncbi:hypothetical protein FQR65_LT02226 [Abscondita terminalis]|nr:hypothetical protein FQR65_LT02226 [Abscondita terminalis]